MSFIRLEDVQERRLQNAIKINPDKKNQKSVTNQYQTPKRIVVGNVRKREKHTVI